MRCSLLCVLLFLSCSTNERSENTMIDNKEFWEIIDSSNHKDWKKYNASLIFKLEKLSKEKLLQYSEQFQTYYHELYRSDLFYLVNKKLVINESAFNVFRKWIIYQGEDIYHLALNSEERFLKYLSENVTDDYFFVDNPDFNVPQRAIFYKKFNEDIYKLLKSHPSNMK